MFHCVTVTVKSILYSSFALAQYGITDTVLGQEHHVTFTLYRLKIILLELHFYKLYISHVRLILDTTLSDKVCQ
jgi:hypothetical protein